MRGGAGAGAVLMFLLVGAMALRFESSTLACRGTLVLRDDYPKLELSLRGLTDTKYGAFIARLRESLGSSEEIWNLPVLRSKASVQFSQRFVLVDLTNHAGDSATLALDVTNAYLVGYRVGGDSFFTRPEDDDTKEAISHLFQGTERHMLPFTGAYDALEQAAGGARREDIPLGVAPLDDSVRAMNLYAGRPTPSILGSVARGLIVGIQMISEAARFRYIEFEMKSRIRRNVDSAPHASMTHMENQWSDLSKEVQKSYSDGVFQRTIQIQRPNDSGLQVSVVQTVLPYISLLLFYCKKPTSSLELRRPPAAAAAALPVPVIRLVTSESDPTCPAHIQSTLRILGPDGLCVDVRDGRYDNGNPVQLWPCQSNNYRNQLWTFSADGTLRSNGKCLASHGNKIVIYDCRPGVDAFTWHPSPSGTISSASGLVLSADSSEEGTTLSARDNTYATGQSWLPTNSTHPSVHQIAGLSGLYCLHTHGDVGVVLRECEEASRWALYPDSSIRPDQRRRHCLVAPSDAHQVNRPGRPLKIVSCDPNSPLQRWLFGNDGSIISLSTDLVMDVRGSAVPGAQLTLNARAGTATQEWQALL